jgi:uncharacterized membrane protein
MKFKSFIIAFISFVLITTLLYAIGYMFSIDSLMFHHEYIDNANGYYVTTGSVIPILAGFAVALITEKIYIYTNLKKFG